MSKMIINYIKNGRVLELELEEGANTIGGIYTLGYEDKHGFNFKLPLLNNEEMESFEGVLSLILEKVRGKDTRGKDTIITDVISKYFDLNDYELNLDIDLICDETEEHIASLNLDQEMIYKITEKAVIGMIEDFVRANRK